MCLKILEFTRREIFSKRVRFFQSCVCHQILISAINAIKKSETSQSRITRWIDRITQFTLDIKHLAGTKIGVIDYNFRNPVGLALSSIEYDDELILAWIKSFISNFELISIVIMNNTLANENRSSNRLIKKRANLYGMQHLNWISAQLNISSIESRVHFKHFKHSTSVYSIQIKNSHLTKFTLKNQQTK